MLVLPLYPKYIAIYSLSKYFLNAYCVSFTIIGTGDGAVNQTDQVSALKELIVGEIDNKQINVTVVKAGTTEIPHVASCHSFPAPSTGAFSHLF